MLKILIIFESFLGEFLFVPRKSVVYFITNVRNRFTTGNRKILSFEKIISINVICRLMILLITVSDKLFFNVKLQGLSNKPENSKNILPLKSTYYSNFHMPNIVS